MGLSSTKVGTGAKTSSSSSSPISGSGSSSGISIVSAADVNAALDRMFSIDLGPKVPGLGDFVTLTNPQEKYVGLLYGKGGVGKTFLACSTPGVPSYLINLDGRAEKTVRDLLRLGFDIKYLPCGFPLEITKMEHGAAKAIATRVFNRVIDNYNLAKEDAARTGGVVVVDTIDELKLLVQLMVRGRTDRPAGTKEDKGDYGKSDAVINQHLWYFSQKAREGIQANLIFLSRSKELGWGPDATGEQTHTGHYIFYDAADWAVEVRHVSPSAQMLALAKDAKATGKTLTPIQMLRAKNAGPALELQVAKGGCAYKEAGRVYRESDWVGAGLSPMEYLVKRLDAGAEGAIVDEEEEEKVVGEEVAGEEEDWGDLT